MAACPSLVMLLAVELLTGRVEAAVSRDWLRDLDPGSEIHGPSPEMEPSDETVEPPDPATVSRRDMESHERPRSEVGVLRRPSGHAAARSYSN